MTSIGQLDQWLLFYAYSINPGVLGHLDRRFPLGWVALSLALAGAVLALSHWFCGYLRRELGESSWFGPAGHWRAVQQWFLIWYFASAWALYALIPLSGSARLVWLLWLALLGLLGLIDAQTAILPNELTLVLLLGGLLWQGPVLAHGLPPPDYVWGVLVGWAWPTGVNAWHQWRHRTIAIGQGDAKFLAALGAWLGLASLPVVWLVACTGVLVYTAVTWVMTGRWHSSVTFGPFLALGASAAMFLNYA